MAKQPSKSRRSSKMMDDTLSSEVRVKARTKRQDKGRASRADQIAKEEVQKIARRTLVCIGSNQKAYKQKIESSTITFALGPAGTGKTHIPTMIACKQLDDKKISRIIVSRPAVSDEDYGALPGDINDKTLPWFSPVRDIIVSYFGASHVDNMVGNKTIEFVPFGHLRGNTYQNAFIILDEAQNTTPKQMKTFLTRIGHHATVAVTGDLNQSDIRGPNGLADAIERLHGKTGIQFQVLTKADIVRSDIVRVILDAYEPDGADDLNTTLMGNLSAK